MDAAEARGILVSVNVHIEDLDMILCTTTAVHGPRLIHMMAEFCRQ